MMLRQILCLKLDQKLLVRQALIIPSGVCPFCNQEHSDEQISNRWSSDPYDITIRCMRCKKPFIARLEIQGDSQLPVGHFNYLCPEQLFTALRDILNKSGRKNLGFNLLLKKHPTLFWNMIRHHGRYALGRTAFTQWNTPYSQKLT